MSLLQNKTNVSAGPQYQSSQELMLFTMLSFGSSCSFLYINVVSLVTLRSKAVFCETPRYVLLYNLLCADTAHMVTNLLLFLLGVLRMKVPYFACVILILLSVFTVTASPVTLVIMSLERYVAVCHPLRHAAIFKMRSMTLAIALVWAFSVLRVFVPLLMLLLFTRISVNVNMNMEEFCIKEAVFFAPVFNDFEQAYSSVVFLTVAVTIVGSYVGVALVARSVSKDKASARKALHTLLLHLIQLSLIIISTLFSTIVVNMAKTVGRLALIRLYNICFVCLSILPRCLSALIYALRDQTLRELLMKNLCCQCRCSGVFNRSS